MTIISNIINAIISKYHSFFIKRIRYSDLLYAFTYGRFKYKVKDGHYNCISKFDKYDFNVKDNKFDGLFIFYNKNDVLRRKTFYKNGERHGLSKFYDDAGNALVYGIYKNGEREGYHYINGTEVFYL